MKNELTNNIMDNIKIPWNIEISYKGNDDLSTLFLMEINLENNNSEYL